MTLGLASWAQVLSEHGNAATNDDKAMLCITLDAGTCSIAALDSIRAGWGPNAAAVAGSALRRGLGRVINVWDPTDLEWFAEYQEELLEWNDNDPEERELTVNNVRDIRAAAAEVGQSYLPPDADVRAALRALPPGPIRRSAAALLSEARMPREPRPRSLLDLIHADQGYQSAAVLVTKGTNDAVRHAYDEVQENAMNAGESTGPHSLILLDTRTDEQLAAGIRQLHRVLRTLAWGERLVWAISELQS